MQREEARTKGRPNLTCSQKPRQNLTWSILHHRKCGGEIGQPGKKTFPITEANFLELQSWESEARRGESILQLEEIVAVRIYIHIWGTCTLSEYFLFIVILLYYIRGVNTVIFCLEFCHSWRIKTTYCEISGPREPRNPWKAAAVKIESLKCFCKCCQWFIIYRITGQGLDRMASGSEPSQRSVCLLVERMEGRHGK